MGRGKGTPNSVVDDGCTLTASETNYRQEFEKGRVRLNLVHPMNVTKLGEIRELMTVN
jgi:hypothetical protein